MCKKQTSVSHSSTESEIISLDLGLLMDGFPAPVFWDVVIEVMCHTKSTKTLTNPASGNRCETGNYSRNTSKLKQKENRDVDQLHVDHVSTNARSSQGKSQLYIFENNEAVIKMIIKGRSPTLRHVSITHRVAIDRLFGRINLNCRIQIKYVDTKKQHEFIYIYIYIYILTEGSFTRDDWNHLLCLLNIMNSSMLSCSHFFLSNRKQSDMSKRGQEGVSGEGSAMSKPKSIHLVMAKPRLVQHGEGSDGTRRCLNQHRETGARHRP